MSPLAHHIFYANFSTFYVKIVKYSLLFVILKCTLRGDVFITLYFGQPHRCAFGDFIQSIGEITVYFKCVNYLKQFDYIKYIILIYFIS